MISNGLKTLLIATIISSCDSSVDSCICSGSVQFRVKIYTEFDASDYNAFSLFRVSERDTEQTYVDTLCGSGEMIHVFADQLNIGQLWCPNYFSSDAFYIVRLEGTKDTLRYHLGGMIMEQEYLHTNGGSICVCNLAEWKLDGVVHHANDTLNERNPHERYPRIGIRLSAK